MIMQPPVCVIKNNILLLPLKYIFIDFIIGFCYNNNMYLYRLLTNDILGLSADGLTREGLLRVLAFILALLAALVLHEIAHGLVALWNGDNTAKAYGRLSLNPIRHFDIIGLLMMLLVGFGWAKPVPINPNNFRNRKLGAVTVSVAGVVTNILLAFIAAMGLALFENVSLTYGDIGSAKYYLVYFCIYVCYMLASLNVSFALFNLLPLFPLDGYRLVSCFVNENNGFMRFLRKNSLYIMLGFIVLDYIPIVSNYAPLNLYVGGLGGLILNGFIKFWEWIF